MNPCSFYIVFPDELPAKICESGKIPVKTEGRGAVSHCRILYFTGVKMYPPFPSAFRLPIPG